MKITEVRTHLLEHRLDTQGQRGLTVTALSGIDVALSDIKGEHFGVPVSTLLGGRFRESIRAYATGAFKRDGVDRVVDNAEETTRHRAAGFHAMKSRSALVLIRIWPLSVLCARPWGLICA